jgi:hypothetical protein
MHDVNLKVFDFDYDLTWWSMFIDPYERVYSRYGGRDEQSLEGRLSVAGLKETMRQVLAAHQAAGKTPPSAAPPVVRPVDLFGAKGKCMHCHQVNEAFYKQEKKLDKRKPVQPRFLPLPENVGVTLDVDFGNRVHDVRPGSAAARAGVKSGDVLTEILETRIFSQGDVMWALRQAPERGQLPWQILRAGASQHLTLDLPAGWKTTDLSWRRSAQKVKKPGKDG